MWKPSFISTIFFIFLFLTFILSQSNFNNDGADSWFNSESDMNENTADVLLNNPDSISMLNSHDHINRNHLETTLPSLFHVQPDEADILMSPELPLRSRGSSANLENFLVLRTFAAVDFQNLISGFESWDEFSPCAEHTKLEMKVDILLFFSSSWSDWPAAQEAAEYVFEMFSNNSFTWAHCFDNLYLGSAFLDHGEDIYSPKLMGVHEKWVNGPNRQFERALRAAGNRGYDLVYLMEVDSTPVRVDWLSSLFAEIESKKPFAVLGR